MKTVITSRNAHLLSPQQVVPVHYRNFRKLSLFSTGDSGVVSSRLNDSYETELTGGDWTIKLVLTSRS